MTHVCIRWDEIREVPEAYRLVALFRASNPMLGDIHPEDMHWEMHWAEKFVPIDMGLSAASRAAVRVNAISELALSCAASSESTGPKLCLKSVPHVIRNLLFERERSRIE